MANSDKRLEEFITDFRALMKKHPYFRLGQGIVNAAGVQCPDLFHMPDDKLTERVRKLSEGEFSPEVTAHYQSAIREARLFERRRCASMVGHYHGEELVAKMLDKPEPKVRGVDFDCEECGTRAGSILDNGWYRCKNCGYPGQ